MDDPRFRMLTAALPDERKRKLVAALEPLTLLPRGSAGTTLPKGATTVTFDVPEGAVLMMSPNDRVEVNCKFQKTLDATAAEPVWVNVKPGDAKDVLLSPNFIAHAFSAVRFMVDNKQAKVDGFIPHGLAIFSSFLLSHVRKEYKKANFTFYAKDPANHTFLKTTDWELQPTLTAEQVAADAVAPADNAYKKALTELVGADGGPFKVNFRPLTFPFYLGEGLPQYGQLQHVIPPMSNATYSIEFDLAIPYSNCVTVREGLDPKTRFRLTIDSMELHLTRARMTALGERAIREKQKASLLRYPGSTVVQQQKYLKGEQGGTWIYDDIVLPTHILIQAMDPNVLVSGSDISKERTTVALHHRIGEVNIRWEGRDFYINRRNQLNHEGEGKLLRRIQFCQYPFFDAPVVAEMWDGEIGTGYAHSHLLFSLLANPLTGEKMQTIGTVTDPQRGKLTIHVKCSDALGFHPMYLVTFYYRGAGVYLNRGDKTFTSSVFDI